MHLHLCSLHSLSSIELLTRVGGDESRALLLIAIVN
jgi:hypothetical protein